MGNMEIFRERKAFQQAMISFKSSGRRLALVPTMGFLHEGHLSLIREARKHADAVAVSIFVNPIQFGPNEDLAKYPRDFERDVALCEKEKTDFIFAPVPEEMYSPDASTRISEKSLSQGLCGALRPGHFEGVCTVVAKLFNLSQADVAVFGEKDAQQLRVIRRMVRDLDFPVEIIAAPLVRDADGLALSSRNRYLSAEERQRALILNRTLAEAVRTVAQRGAGAVKEAAEAAELAIRKECDKFDYLQILDAETLRPPEAGCREIIILAAAYFGSTRLIDNMRTEIRQ